MIIIHSMIDIDCLYYAEKITIYFYFSVVSDNMDFFIKKSMVVSKYATGALSSLRSHSSGKY